ncbi:NADH dehydrogenase [ubiquinone] 1 alpha subcomplex subunit 3 isoform X1 [Moschus berezovskii]|uniref:NADH dehydrogenase [ubiquinone] 1 alpha subcomplex subunit 3 isoform X1 n=1 Tax=Moschus berezovskii TaxID=68408 RepID=UPI0024440B73|nr:NADH dehydrogenase [ubiquinone] 1 alpha subcomplex subunit 3 isoform X1 [Moschus berezovskii]
MAERVAAFLKNVWAKEPVLVASFAIAGLAVILPTLSPYTKYSLMINRATPYNYPGLEMVIFVAATWDLYLWHVGSSSLTRGQTWAPCLGSTES